MPASARLLALFALIAPFAASQEAPLQLLKKVAANYAALSKTSYDFEQVEVRESSGQFSHRTEMRRRIVGGGGRYREEALPSGPLYLFDGQHRWTYNPENREYTKSGGTSGIAPSLSIFQTAASGVKSARMVGNESIDVGPIPVVCQVIEVEREPSDGRIRYSPMTYWIDPGRNIVLKQSYRIAVTMPDQSFAPESTVTVSFSKAAVGGPIDESLLRFAPPADAIQVERLSFGPKSTLTGKESPEFDLKNDDGRVISGASLRGRMVLLQFGPSTDTDALLLVEMIYRSLQGKGLTAFYVITSRDRETLIEGRMVPTAIDADGSLARKFGLSIGGMVLIDRLGKIVYAHTSSRNSLKLVRALQAAGVW